MLGYGGRGNRREFITGVMLCLIVQIPVAWCARLAVRALEALPDRSQTVMGLIVLGLVVTAVALAVIWGMTALTVRRTRDIGWPIWIGLLGLLVSGLLSNLMGPVASGAWIGLLTIWPSRNGWPTEPAVAREFT